MNKKEDQTTRRLHSPSFWDKAIPIALGIFAVAVAILLIVIVAVASDLLPR